ncbi:MAG: aspartate kinase [Bacteroidota bacterium]
MKVFKFGGASVRHADAVRNICHIIEQYPEEPLVVVVSAMGKTTNALERLLALAHKGEPLDSELPNLKEYHAKIVEDLFGEPREDLLNAWWDSLHKTCLQAPSLPYNQAYDALVSHGELISTHIIAKYLKSRSVSVSWADARQHVRTDGVFRDGTVDWAETENRWRKLATEDTQQIIITQGFIGSSPQGEPTTLGREGSDFSAAIIAACLQAESVTIWKDVPGILNADPKRFQETVQFDSLSYQEAAEMSYYGASVIHPKTIKPLATHRIPLYVRSFEDLALPGTVIGDVEDISLPATYIVKDNQALIRFGLKEFTFVNEENLSRIFHVVDSLRIRIRMMQNSAISFSICIDNREDQVRSLLRELQSQFFISVHQSATLLTIKNYEEQDILRMKEDKEVLVEQKTERNFQMVYR